MQEKAIRYFTCFFDQDRKQRSWDKNRINVNLKTATPKGGASEMGQQVTTLWKPDLDTIPGTQV